MPAKTARKPKTVKSAGKAPAKKIPKAKAAKAAGTNSASAKPSHKSAPKADGDAAVQAYLKLLPGWQSPLAQRIDALITKQVPGVKKAVKWHSAMYGVEGQGWFASMGGFKSYLKVNFFDGASLKPVPPGGESKTMRFVDLPSPDALDETQMGAWVKQAAQLPGWGTA